VIYDQSILSSTDVAFGIDGPNFNTGSYFAPAAVSELTPSKLTLKAKSKLKPKCHKISCP
jgi:hypothetical protein